MGDVDLFGSDEEEDDEEKKRITEERLKAYNEKKAKKPKVIAKTSVLFDVKPWDDETHGCHEESLRLHRDGRSSMGSFQAGACWIWNQQAAVDVHRRGREGLHRGTE